jgi:hypothetical protein
LKAALHVFVYIYVYMYAAIAAVSMVTSSDVVNKLVLEVEHVRIQVFSPRQSADLHTREDRSASARGTPLRALCAHRS